MNTNKQEETELRTMIYLRDFILGAAFTLALGLILTVIADIFGII